MIVAIDGPAGAGKSTVARAVAARVGFAFLDTGALYRATALAALGSGRDASEIVSELEITLGERVLLDGKDVTLEIRDPVVTDFTHRIATHPMVRDALTEKQRRLIHRGNWVAEGRDIGTVVAPDAEVKVFLTASLEERARRRASEHGGSAVTVQGELAVRDARDEQREHSPLIAAEDAVLVDTSGMSLDDVVDTVVALIPPLEADRPSLFAITPDDALRMRSASVRSRQKRL